MPVAWEEFEAVETPKRTSVNWNDFEPVPAPTEPPEPFGPPNPDIAVIPSEPATTPEEQTFRRMTGERALGTALTPPKVGGLFDPVLEAPRLPAPAQVKIQPFEQAIAMAFPGTQLPSAVLGSERAAAINRSAVNIVPETFNFLSSPGGLATLGLGAYGGPVAKTLMSLGFSGDMAWNLAKQVKQLYTDWDKMDGAQRASAITDAAKTALFATGAGVHGVKSGRELLLDRQQPPPLPQPVPPVIPQQPAPPVIPQERVLVPPPLPERPVVPPPLPEVEKPLQQESFVPDVPEPLTPLPKGDITLYRWEDVVKPEGMEWAPDRGRWFSSEPQAEFSGEGKRLLKITLPSEQADAFRASEKGFLLSDELADQARQQFTPAVPVPEKPTGPATVPATPAQATVAPAGEISKDAQTLLNDPKFIADAKAMETRDHPELAAKHPDAMDQIPVDEIKDDPAGYKKAVEQFKEEQPKEQPADPIVAAAFKKDGHVFDARTEGGITHMEADMAAEKVGVQVTEADAGFVTKSGKFLTREEAYEHAKKTKQIISELDTFDEGKLHTGKMPEIEPPTPTAKESLTVEPLWSSTDIKSGKAMYFSNLKSDADAYSLGRESRQYTVTPKNPFDPETSSDAALVKMFDDLGGIHEAPQKAKFQKALLGKGYDGVIGGESGYGGQSKWVVVFDKSKVKEQPAAVAVEKAKDPIAMLSEFRNLADSSGQERLNWINTTSSASKEFIKPEGLPSKMPWVKNVSFDPNGFGGMGIWNVEIVIGKKSQNYGLTFAEGANNPDFAAAKALITEAGFRIKKGEKIWETIEGLSRISDQDRITFKLPPDQLLSLAKPTETKKGAPNAIQEPSTESVHVRETPADSEAVAQGVRPAEGAAQASQQTPPAKARDVVLEKLQDTYDKRRKNLEGFRDVLLREAKATEEFNVAITASEKNAIINGSLRTSRASRSAKNAYRTALRRFVETERALEEHLATKTQTKSSAPSAELVGGRTGGEHVSGHKLPPEQNRSEASTTVTQPPAQAPIPAAQAQVSKVARTEGTRSAKEIKSELVSRLEDAVKAAPSILDERPKGVPIKVTIEIPGDGTFTVFNTKEQIQRLLNRAVQIETKPFEKKAQKPKKNYGVMPNDEKSWDRANEREKRETLKAILDVHGQTRKAYEAANKYNIRPPKEWFQFEDAKTEPPQPAAPEPGPVGNRTVDDLSMVNPLHEGDTINVGGNVWEVSRGAYGWKLHEPGKKTAVHPTLKDIDGMQEFISAIKEQPSGPVGMGGAVPSEFGRVGGSPSATKFRMMDEARVARGLKPLLKPESKKDQAVLDEAMGRYDNDPAGADVLAKELIDKPRPITDVENDYLLLRWIDTRDQYHRSAREAQLADKDGRTADLAAINGQTARWSAAMTTLEQALRVGGSETGRALRARRILIAEDFTLAGMENRLRTELQSQGMPESEIVKQLEAKRGELQKLADQYKAAAEAAKDLLSDETQARKRAEQALADIQKQVAGQPRFDKRVLDYAEKFVSGMEKIADGYMKELQGAVWSPTPDMLAKAAFIGATKIARGVKDLAAWTDEMAANLGDKFRPYAKQVWDMSQKALDKQLSKVPEGVKKAVKMVTPQDRRTASLKQVKTRLEKQQKDISGLVQKIARTHVEEGIREREALIDAVHADLRAIAPDMTRRDVMDAISGYGDYRQISKDEIAVVLRDLKGQMQQVGKLQDMAGGRAPSKTGFERRTPSDEERRLIQQVEEAKKRGGYTVTDPEAQLKTAMDALHTRLRNQITDLETQIANREKIVKKRTRLQYDEEANRLKARRDELKKVFDEVFPKEPMTEAERLDRWNRHLEKRIGEFERRIKERDFSKRERAKPPVPDERALANLDRMEQVQEQFHELLLREKYRNMKLHEKAWVATKEALNIPRNVMTSADVSAVLRQGGILAGSHPEIAAKALTPMFRGMASERLAGIVDQEILQRPNAKSGRYAQAKLYLAPLRSTTLSAMEEQIMSRFAHHIPVVRASNRAFITFLNRLRADAFDKLTEKLEENGKPLTDAELKAIGNYINISTGRGEMGRFAAASEALATTFFSPRLVVSRFQYMMGQPLWRGSARTRKLIAMEYARSLTALGVVLGLATVAGATVDTDPRSSDFGKMRFGNTRLDPMAGLSQTAVLMTRLFTGQKKTSKGEIVPIRGNLRFGLENTADVVWRFLRSKFSPVVGTALNIASGENVVGEPVTAGQEIGKMLIPLSFQDVFNVMREQGVAGGTAMLALSLLGMGMQYYEPKPSSQNKRPSRPSRSERPNR